MHMGTRQMFLYSVKQDHLYNYVKTQENTLDNPSQFTCTCTVIHWNIINLINFVVISLNYSYRNFTAGSTQYQWLESDLASVDRNVTPWIILAELRSIYIAIRTNNNINVMVFGTTT